MTSLSRYFEPVIMPTVLLHAENKPGGRTRRSLTLWGAGLVLSHVIYQLVLKYPSSLKSLVPELWWNLLAAGSIELIFLALLIPLLLKRDGLNLGDIGFAPSAWTRDLLWGFLAGAGIWIIHHSLLSLAMSWTGGANVNTGMASIVDPIANGPAELAGVLISIVVLGPLTEEVLYRGCLMASTRSCLGGRTWTAAVTVVLSGLIFAVVHALGHPLYSVVYFVTGLAFALIYQKTGLLAVSVFAHATVNAMGVLSVYLQVHRG